MERFVARVSGMVVAYADDEAAAKKVFNDLLLSLSEQDFFAMADISETHQVAARMRPVSIAVLADARRRRRRKDDKPDPSTW